MIATIIFLLSALLVWVLLCGLSIAVKAERLRNALTNACNLCYRCHGTERIAGLGGLACPICSRWRAVLRDTL